MVESSRRLSRSIIQRQGFSFLFSSALLGFRLSTKCHTTPALAPKPTHYKNFPILKKFFMYLFLTIFRSKLTKIYFQKFFSGDLRPLISMFASPGRTWATLPRVPASASAELASTQSPDRPAGPAGPARSGRRLLDCPSRPAVRQRRIQDELHRLAWCGGVRDGPPGPGKGTLRSPWWSPPPAWRCRLGVKLGVASDRHR